MLSLSEYSDLANQDYSSLGNLFPQNLILDNICTYNPIQEAEESILKFIMKLESQIGCKKAHE